MILMYYWNPARLKELKQRGLKLKYYKYDIRMRDKTIEELESEQADKQGSEQASSDQASEEDSSNKR